MRKFLTHVITALATVLPVAAVATVAVDVTAPTMAEAAPVQTVATLEAAPVQTVAPFVTACVSNPPIHATANFSASGAWVKSSTQIVDCGGYYRLQSHLFSSHSLVDYIYASPEWGNPSVYWYSQGGGNPINGIDAYSSWDNGFFLKLNNAACYKPCVVHFDGRAEIIGWSNQTFNVAVSEDD
jgi:hypothetical protein